jgi:hypothetical protein
MKLNLRTASQFKKSIKYLKIISISIVKYLFHQFSNPFIYRFFEIQV